MPAEGQPANHDGEDGYDCEEDYCVVVSQFVGYEAGDRTAECGAYVDNRQDRVGELVAVVFAAGVRCHVSKRDKDSKLQEEDTSDCHAECWCRKDTKVGMRG